MSGIVLSNSVRQNLSSLQATAELLSQTQGRLSSGKKVNTALDNPTNFFTAAALDARASDINNLLDGIGNGVQILQSANTGLSSLNKLVDTMKSIANQALQTPSGYSTKSNVSTTIAGATADDLRGTTVYANATAVSNVLFSGAAGGTTAATSALTLGGVIGTLTGAVVNTNDTDTTVAITTATLLNDAPTTTSVGLGASTVADGDSFTVNGKTITFKAGAVPSTAPTGTTIAGNLTVDADGNSTIYIGASSTTSTATVGDVLNAIDLASGVAYNNAGTVTANTSQTLSSITAGAISLKSSTGADLSISGKADFLKAFGLTASVGGGLTTVGAARTTSAATVGALVADGSTLNVDGKTITFKNGATPAAANVASGSGVSGNVVTDGSGNSTVYLNKATIADILKAIDLATGVQTAVNASGTATLSTTAGSSVSTVVSGALKISTGTAADLAISGTGNALAVLGFNGPTGTDTSFNATRAAAAGGVNGKTLTFTSFKEGTAVNVTFGDGTGGTVKTLAQLNTALQANNQTATVDAAGKLVISASNDFASSTLGSTLDGGVIGGTLTTALTFSVPSAPVEDPVAQTTRGNLVKQYNDILQQINTTAADASFNGVNLLNGDTLKLVFNETGKSTLNVTGVTFNSSGLGLKDLTRGVDFIDNNATNAVLKTLNNASTTLRSQASALGSNLTIVQTRQTFSKDLIAVLQTGSSNLTLADTNEEAANSQALSTRQSIAVSALSLANTSQQSVLQLLR
jgi:flagellin-like hook-associated protein FlgL